MYEIYLINRTTKDSVLCKIANTEKELDDFIATEYYKLPADQMYSIHDVEDDVWF